MCTRPLAAALLALGLALVAPPLAAAQDAAAAPLQLGPGQALLHQGDLAGGAAHFQAMVEQQPQNAAAWYYLGYARHAAGELDAALQAHERAASLASNPQIQAGAHYNAACVHARQGRADAAFAALAAAAAVIPPSPAQLAADSDLASLHDDPRWAALVAAPPPGDGAAFAEADAVILHEWRGEAPGEFFGWVARRAGDLDGDGVVDVITSAHQHAGGRGRAYAFSSKGGERLWTVTGEPGELLGFAVAAAGDVDGDGTPDVALGAPANPRPELAGRVLVVSGVDGSLLREIAGSEPGEQFGSLLAGDVDLDGDGVLDLAVGAPKRAGGAGAVSVHALDDGRELQRFDGAPGESLGLSLAASTAGPRPLLAAGATGAGANGTGQVRVWAGRPLALAFTLDADATGSAYGYYFSSFPGDLDGDGTPDLLTVDFGNTARGPNTGRAYVHSGADGERLHTFTGKPGDGLGIGVSRVGDVDGDGTPDLLIGSWLCSDAANQGGAVTLFSGADGAELQRFTCTAPLDQFGYDTDGLGDVDGDGVTDFVVTSANSGVGGPSTGRVFVLKGAPKRAE